MTTFAPEAVGNHSRVFASPAELSGLEPLPANGDLVVRGLGVQGVEPRDSLAIITGSGSGFDGDGAPAPFAYRPHAHVPLDARATVTRIVDVSSRPIHVYSQLGVTRAHFAALSYADTYAAGGPTRRLELTPLLPGEKHPIKDGAGEIVGWYVIGHNQESGKASLTVAHNGCEQTHVRVAGLQPSGYLDRAAIRRFNDETAALIGGVSLLRLDSRTTAPTPDARVMHSGRLPNRRGPDDETAVVTAPLRFDKGREPAALHWVFDLLQRRQTVADNRVPVYPTTVAGSRTIRR